MVFLTLKIQQKIKLENTKDVKMNWIKILVTFAYNHSDLTSRIIKNCRAKKRRGVKK